MAENNFPTYVESVNEKSGKVTINAIDIGAASLSELEEFKESVIVSLEGKAQYVNGIPPDEEGNININAESVQALSLEDFYSYTTNVQNALDKRAQSVNGVKTNASGNIELNNDDVGALSNQLNFNSIIISGFMKNGMSKDIVSTGLNCALTDLYITNESSSSGAIGIYRDTFPMYLISVVPGESKHINLNNIIIDESYKVVCTNSDLNMAIWGQKLYAPYASKPNPGNSEIILSTQFVTARSNKTISPSDYSLTGFLFTPVEGTNAQTITIKNNGVKITEFELKPGTLMESVYVAINNFRDASLFTLENPQASYRLSIFGKR